MISAIVFTPDSWSGGDIAREREVVVRSLVWLVSAVVSGVVRDVTLAVPAGLGLGEVADQSGCALVQSEREADRLTEAVSITRESRLLIMKAGFQPDSGLVEEIDIFVRREPEDAIGILLATPSTAMQRIFQNRGKIVGLLLPRNAVPAETSFAKLVRSKRRRGTVIQVRARPIL